VYCPNFFARCLALLRLRQTQRGLISNVSPNPEVPFYL